MGWFGAYIASCHQILEPAWVKDSQGGRNADRNADRNAEMQEIEMAI
jgi:hypothetical protein